MFKRISVILAVTFFLLAMTGSALAEGRKMGLFVGINEYDGVEIPKLKSCVNDAVNTQKKLSRKYGFEASNMSLLTDADATRANILAKLEYYERQISRGDLFVFYYSGHGAIYPDALSGLYDETAQITPPPRTQLATGYYDSTLIPVDAHRRTSGKDWGNMILDDELYDIFSRFTAKGVQVVFISDSCHSGTLAKSLGDTDLIKFALPTSLSFNTTRWNKAARRPGRETDQSFNNLYLVIGSSEDGQFSQAGGYREMSLFTKVFLRKLDEFESANSVFTYQSIVESVRPEVDRLSRHEQTPRLDDRFFDKSLTKRRIFSLLSENAPVITGDKLRIAVKVTDEFGNPLTDAAFGVFRLGVRLVSEPVKKSDVLMLGRTNRKGLFDSDSNTLETGSYQIKVVKPGYRAFVRNMEVVPAKNNVLVFVFKLVRE